MNWKLLTCFSLLFNILSWSQEVNHSHSIHHSFIENKGQWPSEVLFKSHFDGGNLWIQQNKFVFHLQDFSVMQKAHTGEISPMTEEKLKQDVVHLNFVGSQKVDDITTSHKSREYYNYFIGNNEHNWASECYGYGEAIMHDLYKGIDLKLIEQGEELKYEFHVGANVDPNQIVLNYEGQEKLLIDKKGNLVIQTIAGTIVEQNPYAYQIVNGRIKEVDCEFILNKDKVTFKLGNYNEHVPLIIDPVLIFATYSGSVTDNFGMTATYGYDGTAYSGGMIYGNAYPTPDNNAFDINSNFTVADNPVYGITDAFISKYSPDGTSMIWTTFLGGGDGNDGTETAQSMICDRDNNVYLYGSTSSTDFPIVGGVDNTHNGGEDSLDFYQNGVHFTDQGTDIYIAKISSDGQNLMASTYFGGSGNDGVNYQDGMTYYSFGTYALYSDYGNLTTNYGDQFRGEIMLDNAGNCLVASCTKSIDFPTVTPFQASNAGDQDGVLFKLTNDLSSVVWSSYYGGSGRDACYSIKVDSTGNFVCSGGTESVDLPFTTGGLQPTFGGGSADGFIFKLDPSGAMNQATYFGRADYDQTFFVEIDRLDNVFVVGQTNGGHFQAINASFTNPSSGQVVAKIDPTLTTILNQTVFGDGNPQFDISPSAFLVDICGNIYISGWGDHLLQSTNTLGNMPISSDALYSTAPNGFDFYLIVIERDFSDILYATYFGEPGTIREHVDGGTSRFDKNGIVYQSVCGACGSTAVGGDVTTPGAWSETDLSNNCNNLVFKFDFELIPKAEFIPDNTLGCATMEVTFSNFSSASDSYLWDFGNDDTTSIIYNPTMIYDSAGVYDVYLYVTDSICLLTDTAHVQITVTDSLTISTSMDQELCSPVELDFTAFSNGTGTQFIWSSSINFSDTLNTDLSDSTLTIIPSGTTTYYVEVSNPGCSTIDSVTVNFVSSDIVLSGNTNICIGETTSISVENLNPSINFTYEWSEDSIIVNQGPETVVVNPTISQYVYITASADNGCLIEDSIFVNVGVIPDGSVTASADQYSIPVGEEVQLTAYPGGYSYSWTPSELVHQPTNQSTGATIDETTLFTVHVTDGVCTKTDTVLVTVFPYVCEDPYVFVPNAFSPDGDNVNDVLYVRGGVIEEMVFRIFDRWGEMVFESYSIHDGWDGTFRGKALDPDVYDYYLEVYCINGDQSIIKGNIQLIK